jgi:hypothetical protein
MKPLLLQLLGFSVFGAALLSAGPAGPGRILYYKSTMMPGQISDQPAKDSMGMDMVPVYESENQSGPAIKIEAATLQRMNLKTGLVTRGPVRRVIRTVGEVAYNERGLRDITTKYDGWLEKLEVDATWTPGESLGEPLFEIYSTELYNAAQLNLSGGAARRGRRRAARSPAPLGRASCGCWIVSSGRLSRSLAKSGRRPAHLSLPLACGWGFVDRERWPWPVK